IEPQNQQVEEVGADGKVRWTITGLSNPIDARVLPGERVLITEQGTQTVSERNLRGDVLWKKQVQNFWPIGGERLANGNTLIAGNVFTGAAWVQKVTEHDTTGKVVWEATVQAPGAVSRLTNGNTLVTTQQWPGRVYELDRKGQIVKEMACQLYASR